MIKQEDVDMIVQIVRKELSQDMAVLCGNNIAGSLLECMKEFMCNTEKLKPFLIDFISKEAEKVVKKELSNLKIPITVSQLSALTGLTKQAIYQRKHRGTLDFDKSGSRIYMSLLEIHNQLLRE